MVPVRLLLKNFMSYGEDAAPLDLSGMHTVCLSGENGNGKSAILDAMTWSLWGESRAGKNKHDDLVRIGADEMSVEFTFKMDGQTYRVLRKRSKRASGNQWELQQESEDGAWRSLTGNNAGETEKAIQKLLRMNYETFLNSAYLRQGNADQFVKQTPGKRKEILADILDLSRYDKLEAKARERGRDSMAESTDLERDINLIDAELAREPEYHEAVTSFEARHAANIVQQQKLRNEADLLRAQQGKLDSDRALVERLRRQEQELGRDLAELESDLRTLAIDHDRWKRLLDQKDTINRQFAELEALRLRETSLKAQVTAYHQLKDEASRLEKQYMAAENQMRRTADDAQRELKQARSHAQELPALRTEIDQLRSATAIAVDREREREYLGTQLTDLRQRFTDLQTRNGSINSKTEELEGRINELDQQQGVCRVCNAPLPPDRVERTRTEYQSQLDTLKAERSELRTSGRALKEQLTEAEKRSTTVAAELEGLAAKRARLQMLEGSLRALEDVEAKLPGLLTAATEAEAQLKRGDFAPELRDRLAVIRNNVALDAGAENELGQAAQRLVQLAPAERAYLQLEHAEESFRSIEDRMTLAEQRKAQKLELRIENAAQLRELGDVLPKLQEITRHIDNLQSEIDRGERDDRVVQQELGRYRQLLAGCDERRKIRVEKAALLAVARKDAEAYDQLQKAFGKKGVQALIIENAIPELEDEANQMLARLTDGDMQVYFQTVREAKTKRDTPIETLEIQVHDNLGTRPLEMYSGGEGFRASFAIRIALSKLLARRAGARLQTLIIDEGFGTQDGKGREKLVDVLSALKDDFERVIVITHIDELKDAFATRIEVVKTPLGSQITVVEGSNG